LIDFGQLSERGMKGRTVDFASFESEPASGWGSETLFEGPPAARKMAGIIASSLEMELALVGVAVKGT
jgi:hypothetical protein